MPDSILSRPHARTESRPRWLIAASAAACLAILGIATVPAPALAATATRAAVEADTHFSAWAASLEIDPAFEANSCATSEGLDQQNLERSRLREALLESLAKRGIEPTPMPAGAGPWPWGLEGSLPVVATVIDTFGTSILVDNGTITYRNRYGDTEVDPVLAARAFYAAHDDEYDFLVVFTNFPSQLTGASFLAYHQAVSNDVLGTGYAHLRTDELFNDSQVYTRKPLPGRLRSFLHMNNIEGYPADPLAIYSQRYSAVTLLGHELSHRWSGRVRLELPDLGPTVILLGRQNSHWSFFFNSGASPLEGNAWGGDPGGFGTLDQPPAYGPLDLYLMGMIPPADVPADALWYVGQPANFEPPYDTRGFDWVRASPPTPGVICTGEHATFTVDDISLTNGYRVPAYPDAPREFRVAIALVVRDPASVTASQLAKIAALRTAFGTWFGEQTLGRGSVDMRLHSIPDRMVFEHRPHGDFESATTPIPVSTQVTIEPWSLPVPIQDVAVTLHWSANGGPESTLPMAADGSGAFDAAIPPQPNGTALRYWLQATSPLPNHESRSPADAPAGMHTFQIGADTGGPSVQHAPIRRWSRFTEAPLIRAFVRDAHGVASVRIEARANGGAWVSQAMAAVGTTDFYETRFTLPGRMGDQVEYRIVAQDVASTPHQTIAPGSGLYSLTLERSQYEDAEAEESAWSHRSLTYARPDQWHREIVNPISGSYSWKVGPELNTVGGVIAPRQNAVLEGPAIQVFPGGHFSFTHRYAFLLEEMTPQMYGIDGGLIEWQDIQRDAPIGRWNLLDPDAGYTHYVSPESDVPMQGYPFFSGTEPFPIDEKCTFPPWVVNRTIRLRFHVLTSSPQARREALNGWIIDNLEIDPGPPPTAVTLEALTAARSASGGVQLAWRANELATGDAFRISRGSTASPGSEPDWEPVGVVAAEPAQHDYIWEDSDPPARNGLLYRVALERDGVETSYQVVQVNVAPRFALHPNVPNPFNPTTRLSFDLPQSGRARLAVFDVRGRLVRVLLDANLDGGAHVATWNGADDSGHGVASGVYLARLDCNGERAVRRMLLVR